jgi:hypothetical protein
MELMAAFRVVRWRVGAGFGVLDVGLRNIGVDLSVFFWLSAVSASPSWLECLFDLECRAEGCNRQGRQAHILCLGLLCI